MSTNEQVAEGTVLGGAGPTSGTDQSLVVIVDGGRSIALPVTLGGGGVAIGPWSRKMIPPLLPRRGPSW